MLQQKKLAIAVSVAIGASMAAMSTAQAYETLFFPHIVKSPTVSTIVSVINTGIAVNTLHYSLFYKSIVDGNAATLGDPCEEYDVPLPTSPADIQTFDISGHFGQPDDLGVLFNDPSINNNWRKANENFALAMNTTDASRGFLLVDDGDTQLNPPGGGGLAGEAFVFEYGEGAAWGYQAWSKTGPNSGAPDMDSAEAFDYINASTPVANNFIPVLPLDEFATAFMVTPTQDQAAGGQWNKDIAATIELRGIAPTADLYTRDEVPVSGKPAVKVVCIGRVDIQDLLSVASEARLTDGGWGSLQMIAGDAVVYKLEYNLGDVFNGETIGGLYNNAFQYNDQRIGD